MRGLELRHYTCLRRVSLFEMRTRIFSLVFDYIFSWDDFTCPLLLALGFATFCQDLLFEFLLFY